LPSPNTTPPNVPPTTAASASAPPTTAPPTTAPPTSVAPTTVPSTPAASAPAPPTPAASAPAPPTTAPSTPVAPTTAPSTTAPSTTAPHATPSEPRPRGSGTHTRYLWLLYKETRELLISKSFWLLLLAMAPLTGMAFIASVQTYAEVSGLNGGSAGVGEALAPLIGVWAPTFSACELAAVFLLPFVAIRLVSGDRESGALKLELQQPLPSSVRIAAKSLILLLGWTAAMLPPLSAIALWKFYGGSIYPPELLTLVLGHLLNAGLTIALAAAMSSFTEHHATAAILTLGTTVGTWILSFLGGIQGGLWESAAQYTPAAMVSQFQHGLIQLDVVTIAVTLILTGLAGAAIWNRIGQTTSRRAAESAVLLLMAAATIAAFTQINVNWDTSESRNNSFPESDEQALKQIKSPLTIEVHLASEDPRRADLDSRALSKLRRVMPHVRIRYISATSIGLFEQTNAGYGEIWYTLNGNKTMTRATTAESVLESIYNLAGIKPPVESDDDVFRGHPLASPPRGAGIVFYLLWPVVILLGAILSRRRVK
jgi:ABC-2 type transport system permease protein